MSQQGVNSTVERLESDGAFVGAVLQNGTDALDDSFDLTAEERTQIVDALRADVEDATDDVEGFLMGLLMPPGPPSAAGVVAPTDSHGIISPTDSRFAMPRVAQLGKIIGPSM